MMFDFDALDSSEQEGGRRTSGAVLPRPSGSASVSSTTAREGSSAARDHAPSRRPTSQPGVSARGRSPPPGASPRNGPPPAASRSNPSEPAARAQSTTSSSVAGGNPEHAVSGLAEAELAVQGLEAALASAQPSPSHTSASTTSNAGADASVHASRNHTRSSSTPAGYQGAAISRVRNPNMRAERGVQDSRGPAATGAAHESSKEFSSGHCPKRHNLGTRSCFLIECLCWPLRAMRGWCSKITSPPTSKKAMKASPAMEAVMEAAMQQLMEGMCQVVEESLQCPICLARLSQPLSLRCGHSFCRECLARAPQESCVVCRQPVRGAGPPAQNIALRNVLETFWGAEEV